MSTRRVTRSRAGAGASAGGGGSSSTTRVVGPMVPKNHLSDEPSSLESSSKDPTYSTAMKNLLICFTGVEKDKRNELAQRVKLMMGYCTNKLTKGATHLVAGHALTDKVVAAHEHGVPVMTQSWIDAVFEDNKKHLVDATDQKYVKYIIPIFHNLVICVSQVAPGLKSALKTVIESNGGCYDADLVRNKTSLLVTPKAEGEKYKHARKWNLPCVTPEWVDACKEAGHIVMWQKYDVSGDKWRLLSEEGIVRKVTSTPLNSMMVEPLLMGSDFSMCSNIGSCPFQVDVPTGLINGGLTPEKEETQMTVPKNTGLEAALPVDETMMDEHDGQVHEDENVPVQHQEVREYNNVLEFKEPEPVMAIAEPEAESETAVSEADKKKLFFGMTFLVNIKDKEEKEEIEKCITHNGACLSCNCDIIILPPVYSPEDVTKKGATLRTKQWVVDCIENNELCENVYYYEPVAGYPKMKRIMKDVVVAVSNYINPEKEYLRALVKAMGGIYQDVFARKTTPAVQRSTHLICNRTDNDKYRAAQKWGTPVVVAEWIIDSLHEKRKLDLAKFDPATRGDSQSSQSAANFLPQTPVVAGALQHQRDKNLKVSEASNLPSTTEKPGPARRVAGSEPVTKTPDAKEGGDRNDVFKTPTARPRRSVNSAINNKDNPEDHDIGISDSSDLNFEVPDTESFLEYYEANKDWNLDDDPSFQRYLAENPPPPEPESPILGAHLGFTREQSRMAKKFFEDAKKPPVPQPLLFPKNPFRRSLDDRIQRDLEALLPLCDAYREREKQKAEGAKKAKTNAQPPDDQQPGPSKSTCQKETPKSSLSNDNGKESSPKRMRKSSSEDEDDEDDFGVGQGTKNYFVNNRRRR